MQKIKSYIHSFSFRAGLIIFLAVSTLLLGQRIFIYEENINTALEDVQLIIDAHEQEMDEEVDLQGIGYLENTLKVMSENMRDRHLYILLKRGSVLTGNLTSWPNLDFTGKYYAEVKIPVKDDPTPLHLLVSTSEYDNGDILLIGYDLERVDGLRDKFPSMIINSFLLSFTVSLVISVLIVWLLARHFRRFNIACDRVMSGNIDYRIHTHGVYDEFDKLAVNINRMLNWIKALLSTFKDSSNAIAHDMRTPLSRLRLELRSLSQRPKIDGETSALIEGQVERLDNIIDMFENILRIAKAESRASTEIFATVDIKQLIRDVLDLYLPIIEDKKLHLYKNLPNYPLILQGDKQLLGQAVVNLIDNACKYTQENGVINVELSKEDNSIMLIVADNGEGIPENMREKAKERFFRLDESRHTSGHGLGLSLVVAVAGLHQGTLSLKDNNPGLRAILTLKA